MPRIIWGQAIDKGLIREKNEDSLFACSFISQTEHPTSAGLFIVADGMGGGNPSQLAVNTIASYLMSFVAALVTLRQNETTIFEAITIIIHDVHSQIVQQWRDDPKLSGGSTLDVALVIDNIAYIAHVGNSRVYLVRKNDLHQITEDHDFLASIIRAGHTTFEKSKTLVGPGRQPYRLLGMPMELEVDTSTHKIDTDTYLLLCTDGLFGYSVEEGTLDQPIFDIIRNTADPQLACEKLIDYANANGGIDNTAVILVKVES